MGHCIGRSHKKLKRAHHGIEKMAETKLHSAEWVLKEWCLYILEDCETDWGKGIVSTLIEPLNSEKV
jgi:hypothetical protein